MVFKIAFSRKNKLNFSVITGIRIIQVVLEGGWVQRQGSEWREADTDCLEKDDFVAWVSEVEWAEEEEKSSMQNENDHEKKKLYWYINIDNHENIHCHSLWEAEFSDSDTTVDRIQHLVSWIRAPRKLQGWKDYRESYREINTTTINKPKFFQSKTNVHSKGTLGTF